MSTERFIVGPGGEPSGAIPTRLERSAPWEVSVAAPADDEVYGYLGPQLRWVQVLMTCAFLLAGASLFRFSVGGSAWLWPMLAVLGINVASVAISAFSGLNARRVTRASHAALVRGWTPASLPSVDVFLPTCGEPMAVLENTYRHVSALAWDGRLIVWVLDDGDRPEVRDAAARFGFEYKVRPDRGHLKKAGNLRHAFRRSCGEFIVIFDADFCPRADFLDHLVPYMDDPEVGIVQSPQVFDTSSQMSWLQRGAGATQELFYRWIQPSRDRAGAPICVGTCAVYRRSALASVGGFAEIEHSEDVHTGIMLLRAGYTTRYVPVVVAKGLCPDDLAGFLNQQYRWCNGSLTLLLSGDASRPPLRTRQRICFWSGFMYYISTAVNVLTLHIPGIAMAMFYSQDVRAWHYVPFLAGVWVYFVLLPMVFRGRWRVEVLRVQMAYSFCHAVALAHKLTGRTAGWVATGAVGASSGLARTISKVGFVGIAVPLALCWAGVLYDVPRYGLHEFWPMVVFVAVYTYVSLPLAVGFARVLYPRKDAGHRSPTRGRRRRTLGTTAENQLPWVDGLGITCVIALGGMVAMAWFDALLPSGVAIAAVPMSAVLVAGLAMRTRALPSLPRPDDGSGGPPIAESGGQRQPQARYQAVCSDGSASSPMDHRDVVARPDRRLGALPDRRLGVRPDRRLGARPDRRRGARPDRRVERAPLAAQVPVLSPTRAVLVGD